MPWPDRSALTQGISPTYTGLVEGHLTYGDIRPYVLPDALDELTGAASGVVELPSRLDWGPKGSYDLSKEPDLRRFYQIVIREAVRVEDLNKFLNASVLRRIWRELWLPGRVRLLWQGKFPELAA